MRSEREITVEQAQSFALHIISCWEGVEARVAERVAEWGVDEEFARQLEADYRAAAGNRELYEASCVFLGRTPKEGT